MNLDILPGLDSIWSLAPGSLSWEHMFAIIGAKHDGSWALFQVNLQPQKHGFFLQYYLSFFYQLKAANGALVRILKSFIVFSQKSALIFVQVLR